MEFSKEQKAFLEFIPVSKVRKNVLQMYAIILFLVPLMVSYYFKKIDIDYQWWKVIIMSFDLALIIVSIPVLINPKFFLGIFHLLMGVTSGYISILIFLSFVIEANSIQKLDIVNLVLAVVIYLMAVFIENLLIVKANFSKYPKQSKISSVLILGPIIGMLVYNLVGNTFKINGMAIASYLLAICLGIPIHSLYRGYLILRFKYNPSDL